MTTLTVQDALDAARILHAADDGSSQRIVLNFLEALDKLTDRPAAPIATDGDGYIVEGAYQNGFDWIDDNAELLVVHQDDLIAFVKRYRDRCDLIEQRLIKYMARVIDVEGDSRIEEGMSYRRIDFEGEELIYLRLIEKKAMPMAGFEP